MTDDDKAEKATPPSSVERPAVSPADRAAQSEWTASDRRGPLNSAEDDDVERIVPAHEIDPVGGVDHPLPPGADPAATLTTEHAQSDDPAVEAARAPAADLGDRAAANAADDDSRPVEPRRSLVPVAAGLVVGALIGAGSAWAVYAQGAARSDSPELAALSSRVDALQKRPDADQYAKLQAGLADLQRRVGTVEKNAGAAEVSKPAAAPDAGLAGKVAALEGTVTDLKSRAAPARAQGAGDEAAVGKIVALQAGLGEAQKRTAAVQAAVAALQGEQKHAGDRVAQLATTLDDAVRKADGAGQQASRAQAGVTSVETQQKTLEGRLGSPALAVVADSLLQQVQAGQPFSRQVDALAALKADAAKIAVLRENAASGVPSAQGLLAEWKPLENGVIATGNTAPAGADFGQRLEHGLFGLVSVRRADGTTGNDLASRVALIDMDLGRGDIAGAYAAWQALPADARARSDAWGAKAKTSAVALATARDLQHAAIEALAAGQP